MADRPAARDAAASPAADEALRARVAAAERESAEKTRFIRHVSHEFRTPLSSIIGFASLLERESGALSDEEREAYLRIVLRNARHLLHVVNDLLNISKVEAGTLEVTLSPLHPAEAAASVVTALAPLAEEHGVRVRVEAGASCPALADSGRLRQVFFNLLENAIKYSPPGGEIVVRARDEGDEVRVEVCDRGPGISAEDQARLFKEFSRVNPPGMRVVGAGLGLALSRMLAEAMGGRIGVRSAPGEGSTFWIALPAASAPPRTAAPEAPAPSARARRETVAVVDDDADLRAYVRAVLERAGYRVAADGGTPGLAPRLADAAPALVLMDLNLAGRSGVQALAELRADDRLRALPVLAFTAAALGAEEARAQGFAGRLMKPAEPDALLAAVDAALEAASPAPAAGAVEVEDGDGFLAPLRARFRAGLAARREAIARAHASGATAELLRELHKLRGTAAGYGFHALADAAERAERGVRAGAEDGADAVTRLLRALGDSAGP